MIHVRFLQRRLLTLSAIVVAVASHSANVFAQESLAWPSKPITWVVGWPAGGSADVVSRLVARRLEEKLGQPIVIENRPGASGNIALRTAANAAADGNTIVTVPGPVITNAVVPEVGKELVGVVRLAKGPMVLVGTVSPGAPANLKALVADAKANPDAYSFATSGNGTSQHLAGELLNQLAGTKIMHIPYKGGAQAVLDVIGGRVPVGMLGITPVLRHIQAGKLKAYAVTTAERSASLPDTPTMHEAGIAGFEASQWFIVAAPKGTPSDRIQKLNTLITEILALPEIAKGFENVGVTPSAATPQDTTKFVVGEQKRWRDLAKKANLPLE